MDETYRTWVWAKHTGAEVKKWQDDEANPVIKGALRTVEEAMQCLVDACQQAGAAVSNVTMDMLKKHIFEELDNARLPNPEDNPVVAVHLESALQRREEIELIGGRSPHYNRHTIVAYQRDNSLSENMVLKAVREIHIGDSDDLGVDFKSALNLVCMWLSEYAERYGMAVEIPEKLRPYVSHRELS